jgi:hypothetical protein
MQKLPTSINANQFILDGEMVVIREDGYSDWEIEGDTGLRKVIIIGV